MTIYDRIKQLILEDISPEYAGKVAQGVLLKAKPKDAYKKDNQVNRIKNKFKVRGNKKSGAKPWANSPEGKKQADTFDKAVWDDK